MLLENSVEQFQDIDEESLQDDSSIEELKVDEGATAMINKKLNKK